jgi:hypothetical protein
MLGDLVASTCQQGGASGATLIDTALKGESGNEDDYFNNQWAILTSGAAALLGNERRISDYAAAGTITPYVAFGAPTQIPAATTYEIHKIWTPTEKRRALNWALRRAYPYIARNIVDDQITTVANTWAYRLGDYGAGATVSYASTTLTDTSKAWITNQFAGYRVQSGGNATTVSSNTATVLTVAAWSPSTPSAAAEYSVIHDIKDIYAVEYELNTSTATYPYKGIPVGVRAHEGTLTIQFAGRLPPADVTLRLRGKGFLTDFTSTETSYTEVEEQHIDGVLFLAAHWLFRRTPSLSASQDRDFYREEANRYLRMWETYKAELATRRFPTKMWSPAMTGRVPDPGDHSEQSIHDTPAVP